MPGWPGGARWRWCRRLGWSRGFRRCVVAADAGARCRCRRWMRGGRCGPGARVGAGAVVAVGVSPQSVGVVLVDLPEAIDGARPGWLWPGCWDAGGEDQLRCARGRVRAAAGAWTRMLVAVLAPTPSAWVPGGANRPRLVARFTGLEVAGERWSRHRGTVLVTGGGALGAGGAVVGCSAVGAAVVASRGARRPARGALESGRLSGLAPR